MGRRKVRRVPVVLNPSDEPPTPNEMDTILLAADEIVMSAGRICFRKHCPAGSIDCAVPGCGAIPLVRAVPDFTFEPAKAFAHRPDVLWRRREESIVEQWYAEAQEQCR